MADFSPPSINTALPVQRVSPAILRAILVMVREIVSAKTARYLHEAMRPNTIAALERDINMSLPTVSVREYMPCVRVLQHEVDPTCLDVNLSFRTRGENDTQEKAADRYAEAIYWKLQERA